MAVTTKKTFAATTNSSTTTFGPIGIELNNQDDLDVYVTLTGAGSTRVLQYRQSSGGTTDSNHPQVNDTTGLYFPSVATGVTLYNYTISADNNNIIFNSALPSGATVSIERRTRDESGDYTSFASGSTIRSTDINTAFDEVRMTAVEARNKAFDLQNTYDHYGDGNVSLTTGKVIKFEGATDDAYETTLTVTDPTADRTFTFGDESGTIVTTGSTNFVSTASIVDSAVTTAKLGADAVTGAKIADDAINSEHYVDGSIDTAHIADSQVTTAKIAADAITGAKIADDAIDSEHYTDSSIDTAHIADSQVTTAKIAGDAITGAKIADDAIDSEHYTDGSIDTAHIANSQVTGAKIAGDAIDGTKLADDAINSEHYVDGSIDTAHIADANITTAKIADNAITIAKVGCEQTTISDSDSHVPTSGAVVDYVAAQIAPIGGLEVIATDAAFPNTQPASGVVISIADAGGLVVNGSGVSTTGRTVGASTVTINGINSSFHSTTIDAGIGMLVTSTGSGQIYDYHKTVIKEADVAQISDDINDFNSRYRIASSAPGSSNDEGDLYFDTTANKMYVYDGSAWGQVTSTGEFKILGIKTNGQAHNGNLTFDNSATQFDLFEGTADANITQAAQLTVVLNGVVQKPNDGTYSGSEEGFYLDGADGIRFCTAPPSGSVCFVIKSGSATEIGVPADNSVSAGKTDISLVQGDVIYANGTDSWTRLAKGTAGQFLKMNSGATAPEWGADNDTTIGGATGVSFNDNVAVKFGTGTDNDLEIKHTPHVNMLEANDGSIAISADEIQLLSNDTAGQALYVDGPNNKLWLGYDGAHSIQITNTEATFIKDVVFDNATNAGKDITWDMSDDALEFADNVKATFGNGADLQIHHNASNSFIDNSTGQLEIRSDTLLLQDNANGHSMFKGVADGAVELYYDNVKEIETKSGGVKLLGHSESLVHAYGNTTGSITVDFTLANHFSITATGNLTFVNPTTESVGQSGTIVITQDGTGSRTAAWGSQYLWAGGTAPTLSAAANSVDRIDYFVAAADKIHCVASLAMA